jgi:hypothetical protein
MASRALMAGTAAAWLIVVAVTVAAQGEAPVRVIEPGECGLPERAPTATIEPAPWVRITDVAAAPDSDNLLLCRVGRAVNLGPAVAQFWWEIAVAAALVILAALAVRRWRRKRRKAAAVFAAVAVVVAAGALLLRGSVPRETWLKNLAAWPSGRAYAWAHEHDAQWMLNETSDWGDVVEADKHTGAVLRVVAARPLEWLPADAEFARGRFGPDYEYKGELRRPQGVFTLDAMHRGVWASWSNGYRLVAGPVNCLAPSSAQPPALWGSWPVRLEGVTWLLPRQVVVSADGTAYCILASRRHDDDYVRAFDDAARAAKAAGKEHPPLPDDGLWVFGWTEGAGWQPLTSVAQSLAYYEYVRSMSNKPFDLAIDARVSEDLVHLPALIPSPEGGRFLILSGDADETGPWLVGTVADVPAGRAEMTFRTRVPAGLRSAVAVSLEDGTFAVLVRELNGDGEWEIRTLDGRVRAIVRLPQRYEYSDLAASADGRFLFVDRWEKPGSPEATIDVLDLHEGRWADRLGRMGKRFRTRVAATGVLVSLNTDTYSRVLPTTPEGNRMRIWDCSGLGR